MSKSPHTMRIEDELWARMVDKAGPGGVTSFVEAACVEKLDGRSSNGGWQGKQRKRESATPPQSTREVVEPRFKK